MKVIPRKRNSIVNRLFNSVQILIFFMNTGDSKVDSAWDIWG